MELKVIRVGMADLKVAKHPVILTTLGLGSCVGIALFDRHKKISGLAHIMLPDSSLVHKNQNVAKFADTAINELLKQMFAVGSSKESIVAKIAGGAQMFQYKKNNHSLLNIGERNVEHTIGYLKSLRIPLVSRDVGQNYGRTVELYSETGRLIIKTICHGTIEI